MTSNIYLSFLQILKKIIVVIIIINTNKADCSSNSNMLGTDKS